MFVRIKGRVHYNIRSMFLSTKNKSVMLQIITQEEKQKYLILHYFARNTKVSYYITFFETLLETAFSCGLCYSNRRIVLSYYEKRKVIFFQEQKGEYITILSTNNKSVMLQIFTL